MTQRIDSNSNLPSILAQTQSRSAGQASSENVSPISGGSSLNLTQSASHLHQLSAASATEASFDAEKVNAIKAALANGSYKIDAASISDRLLQMEQDLIG